MQRKRDGLVPIGEAFGGLGGPVKAIRESSPQAIHHFTRFDQVHQLVGASEADPDLGFMARTMALCSLPRTNPGNRHQYKRQNGPYTLYMFAGRDKLPYGNLPRLILAWVCTEAVRTQNRVLVLGKSLSDFMRELDIYAGGGNAHTKLRNQMKRLFGCTVSLIYEDKNGQGRWLYLFRDAMRIIAGQLGNIPVYDEFLDDLDRVWHECLRVLVPGGRIACAVGDVCISRKRGGRHHVLPLSADIQVRARKLGFDCLARSDL